MSNDVVAAAYLELLVEIKQQMVFARSDIACHLLFSVDSDDVLEIAAELRRRQIRVATNDEVSESVAPSTDSTLPRLVTSAGNRSSRPCDPV